MGQQATDIAARLESDRGVVRLLKGLVLCPSEGHTCTVAGWDVDFLLSEYVGREVLLLIFPVSESETWKICSTCGLPYQGAGCLRCAVVDW